MRAAYPGPSRSVFAHVPHAAQRRLTAISACGAEPGDRLGPPLTPSPDGYVPARAGRRHTQEHREQRSPHLNSPCSADQRDPLDRVPVRPGACCQADRASRYYPVISATSNTSFCAGRRRAPRLTMSADSRRWNCRARPRTPLSQGALVVGWTCQVMVRPRWDLPAGSAARVYKRLLVTGASSGIELGFAKLLAAAGHDLALVARREAALQALAVELEREFQIRTHILRADLAQPGPLTTLGAHARRRGIELQIRSTTPASGAHGSFCSTRTCAPSSMTDTKSTSRRSPSCAPRGSRRWSPAAAVGCSTSPDPRRISSLPLWPSTTPAKA